MTVADAGAHTSSRNVVVGQYEAAALIVEPEAHLTAAAFQFRADELLFERLVSNLGSV